MQVTRVDHGSGSHIEPPLDQDWDKLTKLQWLAAVVSADTGLFIKVHEGGWSRWQGDGWVEVPDVYGVQIGQSSHSARPFYDVWTLLNGVDIGVREARRAVASA